MHRYKKRMCAVVPMAARLANLLAGHGLLNGNIHHPLGVGTGQLIKLVHSFQDGVAVGAGQGGAHCSHLGFGVG